MSKKSLQSLVAKEATVQNDTVEAQISEVFYDAVLTKTVKLGDDWLLPNTVLKGIGIDLAGELQSAGAADITEAADEPIEASETADEQEDTETA